REARSTTSPAAARRCSLPWRGEISLGRAAAATALGFIPADLKRSPSPQRGEGRVRGPPRDYRSSAEARRVHHPLTFPSLTRWVPSSPRWGEGLSKHPQT